MPKPGQYCHDFTKSGRRPREDKHGAGKCIFPHKTQAQVGAGKKAAAPAPAAPAIGVDDWVDSLKGMGCSKRTLSLVDTPGICHYTLPRSMSDADTPFVNASWGLA